MMKKIECIIRQEKLKELADALRLAGVGGLMAIEIKGFGKQTTRPQNYLFLPKTKVEIYVADAQVKEIVSAIIKCCKQDTLGSGKIAILPMDDCIRVRTQERGDEAIF